MDLIRSISWMSASHLRLIRDDDSYIDRLSHRYTVAICVIFCIVVSTKQYAGDPIGNILSKTFLLDYEPHVMMYSNNENQLDCWVPAQFKASYEKYADSYCWIAGSWYTPMDKELPLNEQQRKENRIRYYQWVPFLLLFQAILCYVPRIVWRSLNVRSGLDLVNLVDAAIKYESVDKFTDREKIMSYIVKNVERYIGARKSRYERLYGRKQCTSHVHLTDKQQKNKAVYLDAKNRLNSAPPPGFCVIFCRRFNYVMSTFCFWTGKRLGNYLVVLYLFVKSLWVTNAISQLFLLNRFIGNDYHAFGIEIIEMLLSGQEWHEMRHFPRVTYCDFKIREIGNSHDWTVQCVLRINLFNEVIYIFMWFWLCILAVFSIVDFLTWTMRIVVPSDKLRFVKRHLDIYNCYVPNDRDQGVGSNYGDPARKQVRPDFEYVDIQKEKALMREFTFKYLKDDGIFAMRILASSASDLITTEIISELWKNFRQSSDNSDQVRNTLKVVCGINWPFV